MSVGKQRQFAVAAVFIVLGALIVARPGLGESAGPRIGTAAVEERTPDDLRLERIDYDGQAELLGSYAVADAALLGDVERDHGAIWALVRNIVPESIIDERLTQFNVTTDGPESTLAMVHRSGLYPTRWILSIDRADTDDVTVLRETIVHELAHVLTLNRGDVDFGADPAECDELALTVGCVRAESTMGRFAMQFWDGVVEPPVFDTTGFVTDYAASSAHEDLAETFMAWVLELPVTNDPDIAEKYRFLEAQSELVDARDQIRAHLASA